MSSHSNHSDGNYPEDGVSHYPKKYKTLMGTPTNKPPSKERQYHIDSSNGKYSGGSKLGNHFKAKAKALKKAMGKVGGRFTKK